MYTRWTTMQHQSSTKRNHHHTHIQPPWKNTSSAPLPTPVYNAPSSSVFTSPWHPRSNDLQLPHLPKRSHLIIHGLWIQHYETVLFCIDWSSSSWSLHPPSLAGFFSSFVPITPISLVASSPPTPFWFASIEPPTPWHWLTHQTCLSSPPPLLVPWASPSIDPSRSDN